VLVSESNLQYSNRKGCKLCYKRNNYKLSKTKLYRIWASMKDRCNNPRSAYFSFYGGKGVKLTNTWNDFVVFHKWAEENGYKEGLTIDRIDGGEGYSPSNCRWVTKRENTLNRFGVDLGKTCKNLHPWKPETTYMSGKRKLCKPCSNARSKKRYINNKISKEGEK